MSEQHSYFSPIKKDRWWFLLSFPCQKFTRSFFFSLTAENPGGNESSDFQRIKQTKNKGQSVVIDPGWLTGDARSVCPRQAAGAAQTSSNKGWISQRHILIGVPLWDSQQEKEMLKCWGNWLNRGTALMSQITGGGCQSTKQQLTVPVNVWGC